MISKPHGLGQGLDALLGNNPQGTVIENGTQILKRVPLDLIRPNLGQPRQIFDEAELQDLALSIKKKGVLQPILLRPDPSNPEQFEIVAGERRWRAAQIAQEHEIPAVVRDLNDREALEVALIENIQRDDLNAIEEARGYARLIEEFGETQDGVAQQVGKSRSHVANSIRLLKLPPPVQKWLEEGAIQAGHARALVVAENPIRIGKIIIKQGLSVRQAERLVGKERSPKVHSKKSKSPNTLALEAELSLILGVKVIISGDAERGDILISYGSLDQLDRIISGLKSSVSCD